MYNDSTFTIMFDIYVKRFCKTKMSIMENPNDMESRILIAAEKVFYLLGKEGASMQDIADEAGITRTSLNYYYRSKDKLFEEVFRNTLSHFIPRLAALLESSDNLSEYLRGMVEVIIDSMIERPQIPVFVLQELTSNPGRVPEFMEELGIHPAKAIYKMRNDKVLGNLSFDPRHLIMNLLGMCIFPFAGKPMFVSVMYEGNEDSYISAMQERKKLIPMILEQIIKTNQS